MFNLQIEYGYTFDYWNLTDHTFLNPNYLNNYDVFLIMEQENANNTEMDIVAAAWSGFIGDWVLAGGVVICMAYWEEDFAATTRILNGTGLMEIYNPTDQAYNPVTITNSNDPLAFGVSAFTGPDGTISFDTPDGEEIFGAGGQTVVAHRYLGRGHVVMLGFDLFDTDPNAITLLANAVRLTRLAVFDNSHNQDYDPYVGLNTFATDIQTQFGFAIATMNTWDPALVETSQVLVIVANTPSPIPLNTTEVNFITDFVGGGGGLFATSDVHVFGNMTDPLLEEFGFIRNKTSGYIADTDDNDGNMYQPTYGPENIANHSATIGVSSVQLMGSTAFIDIPGNAKSLIWSDHDNTTVWQGGDPAEGLYLAASLNFGAGRVFALADGDFLSDNDYDTDGTDEYFDLANEYLVGSAMIWLSASGIVEKTVLMEESHSPYYNHNSLRVLMRLLSFNGFNVRWASTFSEQLIDEADVMFIMSGGSENYTAPEKEVIYNFVDRGGGLFLTCDWTGYEVPTNDIAMEFGLVVNGSSYLFDDNDTISSYTAYSGANIADHPIMHSVYRIEIDRSPGFASIGSGTALVTTDDDGTSHWAAGGAADSVPVIAATEYGMGRVVVLPDINFFTSSDIDGDGYSFPYDSDNDIFIANSFYWFVENRHPEVEVLTPNGGEVLSENAMIEWTAVDANRDALTFDIMYSPDNGGSWDTVATGLTGDHYLWDTTAWENGNTSLIRVIAFDGFVEWGDSSDAVFELNNTVPTPTTPTGGEPIDTLLLIIIIGAAGVIIVVVILIIMKKKK
jgi:hypothetical protein